MRDYLVNRGIAATRLRTVSYGEERPIADNNTAEGRAMNRRGLVCAIIDPVGQPGSRRSGHGPQTFGMLPIGCPLQAAGCRLPPSRHPYAFVTS